MSESEERHDPPPEDDPDYNPMSPPGEDPETEDTEEGVPMKSIADEVEGDEETEDMMDVESGDA